MCLPFLSCFFGPGSCCCCGICPSFRNSILTRINYGIVLLVATVISAIILSPGVGQLLQTVSHAWHGKGTGRMAGGRTLRVFVAVLWYLPM